MSDTREKCVDPILQNRYRKNNLRRLSVVLRSLAPLKFHFHRSNSSISKYQYPLALHRYTISFCLRKKPSASTDDEKCNCTSGVENYQVIGSSGIPRFRRYFARDYRRPIDKTLLTRGISTGEILAANFRRKQFDTRIINTSAADRFDAFARFENFRRFPVDATAHLHGDFESVLDFNFRFKRRFVDSDIFPYV